MFAALPFHALLLKILAIDFRFSLPRHIIMFSLSLSDGIQILSLVLTGLFGAAIELTTYTTFCLFLRNMTLFCGISTLSVSSAAVIALSIERYIACIYSFQLHVILTNSRVVYGTIGVWIIGAINGLSAVITNDGNTFQLIQRDSVVTKISVSVIMPTAFIVICIQARLFMFSRTKLRQVHPNAFGVQLELADYRKKQIKVAVVASAVAFAYVICMLPASIIFLYEYSSDVSVPSPYRRIFVALGMVNTLADPFIYGMGVADTRSKVLRDLRRLKQFLVDLLPAKWKNDVSP